MEYSELPTGTVANPLSDKQCNDVRCVLESVPVCKATIEANERCGIDMSAQKERLLAQHTFAAAVKREYMPLHE